MAVDREDVRTRVQELTGLSSDGFVAPEAMRDIVRKTQLEEPDSPAAMRRRIQGGVSTY